MRTLFLHLALSIVALGGCAPRAQLLVLRPAELDLAGIRKLAVIDFSGEGDSGRLARSAIASRLPANPHLAIADPAELSRVAQAAFSGEPLGDNAVVQAAREAGIDGVLLGEVVRYEAGTAAAENGALVGLLGPSQLTAQPPTVTLAIRLIDTRTGAVRAAREITRTYRHRDLPPADVLANLMQGCAEEVVALLSPHNVPIEVQLARQFFGNGVTSLTRGNRLAASGQWEAAATAWQQSLDDNPRNHAARHNLALAAFNSGDRAAALDHLDRAVAIYADAQYHRTRSLLAAEIDNSPRP